MMMMMMAKSTEEPPDARAGCEVVLSVSRVSQHRNDGVTRRPDL